MTTDTMHALDIRRYTPDMGASARHRSALASLMPFLTEGDFNVSKEHLNRLGVRGGLYVGCVDGQIVASAQLTYTYTMRGKIVTLDDVVVHEGWRGRGFGHTLVGSLVERARRWENRCEGLQLTSNPDRSGANKIYKGLFGEPRAVSVYKVPVNHVDGSLHHVSL